MRPLALLPIPLILSLTIAPAIAASKTVRLNELEIGNGRLTVPVPPGDGMVLDFSALGQMVQGAAFGDPTKIVLSGLDGQLCSLSANCQSPGASVLLLRRVSGISLPAQTHSADGGTTLTLITDGRMGRKVLHLRVVPAAKAAYTALVVAPNPTPLPPRTFTPPPRPVNRTSPPPRPVNRTSPPPPAAAVTPTTTPTAALTPPPPPTDNINRLLTEFQQQSSAPNPEKVEALLREAAPVPAPSPQTPAQTPPQPTPQPLTTAKNQPPTKSQANALALGLANANPQRGNTLKISPQSSTYRAVQTAIASLRQGNSLSKASLDSGLKPDFLQQLIKLGGG